jgi:hypothetical protein
MTQRPQFWLRVAAIFLFASHLVLPADSQAAPQRARRERQRRLEAPTVVAAGSQVLPEGAVLILQMETRLDSGSSRTSDRFMARVAAPVMDTAGKTLIPTGSTVEGHVASVTPAQSRRRSGIIAVSFDKLTLPDGRGFALQGMLTSTDPQQRRQIDEEGTVEGGSTTKRSVVFIGGGAASGAVIGAITGGAAIGAGVGAAAGAVGALLAKGKEAVVEPGTRIGLQLTRPLDLSLGRSGIVRLKPGEATERAVEPAPLVSTQQPLSGEPVRVNSVQAERAADGTVRVLITAETPTAGWRVYADQSLDRDTLEIWLRGERPKGMAAQVISHPTVTVTAPDEAGRVRRVLVHGANGDRTLDLPPRSGFPAEVINEIGSKTEERIRALLADYAASLGALRTGTGFEFPSQPSLSEAQVELLFALSNLADSAQIFRILSQARIGAEGLRNAGLRLSASAQEVNRLWVSVRPARDLDRQWRAVQEEIRLLTDAVVRD